MPRCNTKDACHRGKGSVYSKSGRKSCNPKNTKQILCVDGNAEGRMGVQQNWMETVQIEECNNNNNNKNAYLLTVVCFPLSSTDFGQPDNPALYFFLSLATFSQPEDPARQSIQSPPAERVRLRQRSISLTVDPKKASICL